ncbi:MAG: hypothetical protein IIX21_03100, partial [Clostridia bacterium]|nr:hypothetical protein [Clostridia bacterium]
LMGDYNKDLVGTYYHKTFMGYGYGPLNDLMYGYPHFKEVTFDGKFPIAELTFTDPDFPAEVVMTAFNPFIPLDADNSSLPAAFFNIKIRSKEDNIRYTVVFSSENENDPCINENTSTDKYTAVTFRNPELKESDKKYSDITIAVDGKDGILQQHWYRGRWFDSVLTFWDEFTNGNLHERSYDDIKPFDKATVGKEITVNKGCESDVRFIFAWNVPNNYNYWEPYKDDNGNDITWKNYYAVLFKNSQHTTEYAFDNWDMLYQKTKMFCDTLHSQTLDPAVIDAISSTLSVLKSPTVLRLEDGTFYGWEGVHEKEGSCQGTCTHVWSYAYALCFLFPDLERSIRDTEFKYDTAENGDMTFRTALPLGRKPEYFFPCVDGQMATVIKSYREWKISGDTEWLKNSWVDIKKVLAFAWDKTNQFEWDPDRDGVITGRQHHTLDMELFGASSWLEGMYLAALKAGAEMAEAMGETDTAKEYRQMFENGYRWTKDNLFNGEYFIQKIDLSDKSPVEHFDAPDYWNEEEQKFKYQIGEGCEIDQMLGQWHAILCGLGDIFDKDQRKIALKNSFGYLFRSPMRDFVNPWRIFAIGDEAGTVMSYYPDHVEKPVIPIPYSGECMTGFEYAFAGLLMSEGFVDEGLKAVRAIRDRYDGKKRNPWNEIECGSNYARAMASFALLPILSGFEYHVPKKHIGFTPIEKGDFKALWSLKPAWGEFVQGKNSACIKILDGKIELESVTLGNMGKVTSVIADGNNIPFMQNGNTVKFDTVTVTKEIKFI